MKKTPIELSTRFNLRAPDKGPLPMLADAVKLLILLNVKKGKF